MARIFNPFTFILLFTAGSATAQGAALGGGHKFLGDTSLVGLSFEGLNSAYVRQAAREGYELSNGAQVDLAQWYSPRFPNLSATFETWLSPRVSLLWGGSLGEKGEKYAIGPSGMIGFSINHPLGQRSWLHLQAYGRFGGALRESSCVGDYGAIGGVQRVNCRMASSFLPPAQTLDYLWNEPPVRDGQLKLSYEFRF